MSGPSSTLSIRSALVSVKDLDASTAFYSEVIGLRELLREDQIAVLGHELDGPFVLYLRLSNRNATRAGQPALGLRTITFDVGTLEELDIVEQRLKDREVFRDRRKLESAAGVSLVRAYDPDRQPLVFMAASQAIDLAHYEEVLPYMYGLDL